MAEARSLTDLNADVLASICSAVYYTSDEGGLLRRFSTTCKIIRSASVPLLFRSVRTPQKPLPVVTEMMWGLVLSGLAGCIQYVDFTARLGVTY